MTYRNDRDAQQARLEALDRENRELRTENERLQRALTSEVTSALQVAAIAAPPKPKVEPVHALPAPPSAAYVMLREVLEDSNLRIILLVVVLPILLALLAVVVH